MRGLVVAMAIPLAGCADGAEAPPAGDADRDGRIVRILAVADARPVSRDSLEPVLGALAAPEQLVRIHAVRALGRLERPELLSDIAALLDDPEPVVRAEAANAVAQSVLRAGDPAEARDLLTGALRAEAEPDARGVVAQSLGGLRVPDRTAAESTALALADALEAADPAVRLGVAKGLYHLARQPNAAGALPPAAADAIRSIRRSAHDTTLLDRRTRVVAAAALIAARALTMEDYIEVLADDDPYVRREAVAGLPFAPDAAAARTLADVALRDTSPVVRYEALRALVRQERLPDDCATVDHAAADENPHVALYALDLLADCSADPARVARLDSIAARLPADSQPGWHAPAHALVALAALDRRRAAAQLPSFVAHPDPFVRTYAARAAHTLRDAATLRNLADDDDANVRLAALRGLREVAPDSARALAIRQLDAADGELAMVAAETLAERRDDVAASRLFDTLERLTGERRQTSRDPRLALLDAVTTAGSRADSARLRPLLRDFDPVIADRAAAILSDWTGTQVAATPEPLPPATFPTAEELHALARDTIEVALRDGSTFLIRLHPWDAPTNAARFARLARDGYFDGLTIHRVAPNFVVQGGSPGANEYIGAGPYTRDEVGIDGNWRGTVGLSTRGRDTGDGQFYVNLVDNVRLDHEYTVFGEVVSGMAAVREVLEGTRIESVRVRGR